MSSKDPGCLEHIYSELSLFRSPMGLPQVAGISRWPHFRVPRDTRGYIRDSVTCIFSSMQGHCDWLVVTVNNQSVSLVATTNIKQKIWQPTVGEVLVVLKAANKPPLVQTKK